MVTVQFCYSEGLDRQILILLSQIRTQVIASNKFACLGASDLCKSDSA